MSERYGRCGLCAGTGELLRFKIVTTVDGNGDHQIDSQTLHEVLECGRCGGTGFSGDAMDKR